MWEQVKEQRDKGAKRPIPDAFDHLYGGSQWFSITRKAAEALLDYTDQQLKLYGQMWMTFAPEEVLCGNRIGEPDGKREHRAMEPSVYLLEIRKREPSCQPGMRAFPLFAGK